MPTSSDNAPGGQERPPAVLRLTDVAAGYGGAAIVSDVSISVGPGEVVSIIGPNGAGKSTLLKAVTGRLPVMTGTVNFNDRNITNWRGHLLARMGLGFVPQTKDVFDTLTVTENRRWAVTCSRNRSWPPGWTRCCRRSRRWRT